MPSPVPNTDLTTLSKLALLDEKQAVNALLAEAASLEAMDETIMNQASAWVKLLKAKKSHAGVEAFLHEYGLQTTEGIAIMSLAEALLRIPDKETAERLIQDKLGDGNWQSHLGGSDSLLVNASSWGLLITGKLVHLAEKTETILGKLAEKLGEPVVREALKAAMRFIGHQFVMGEDITSALAQSESARKYGYRFSFDILGEGARTAKQAAYYLNSYRDAIDAIASSSRDIFSADSLSVKLSALHPRYSLLQQDRVMKELLPRLSELMIHARKSNVMVAIDAEEASRFDIELMLYTALLETPELKGWNGLGFVLQAYQKRAFYAVDTLAALAKKHNITIPIRLVKGAYWDSEIKWAQIMGLPGYPVFTRKEYTDLSYLATARKILGYGNCFYPQFATHNARTMASIMALKPSAPYEFQRLHGMGEQLHNLIVNEVPSRIYAPVGKHKDLLAYLIRRLLENGANTSFVNLLMDEDVTESQLLADPIALSKSHMGSPHPNIPLPEHIYKNDRKNSIGLDLGNRSALENFHLALQSYRNREWNAGGSRNVMSPSDQRKVGTIDEAKENDIDPCMAHASKAFGVWSEVQVEGRSLLLQKSADTLEANREELIALLMREAGKNLSDAIAEVREAADFCRYYAAEARKQIKDVFLAGPTGESNRISLFPRGIFIAISPWNFPLAIFTGQIAAALATGNVVVAKPAAQTPLIAHRAVELLHAAGIPKDALQLLCGPGSTIGAKLIEHPKTSGVVFTGSVDTAQRIGRALAARIGPIVPFIAETGGQNCMVVDSSALLETALDDIVLSAFGSAGQRCSALRVVMVQEDIADALIELLKGAIAELKLGNPWEFSTDIGPVIDETARKNLLIHIERMNKEAKLIARAKLPEELSAQGHYVAPHIFEIPNMRLLTGEVFGPILHLLRFTSSELELLPDLINSTGYGLTFGIHSRIDTHIDYLSRHVKAGNCYVNRSMIGATVGVQPFGGEGLSGTGPKAGGPHYLTRFMTERTMSINTSAIGGNLSLLS